MKKESTIKARLTLSCQHMGITVVDLCTAVKANASGLYKALNNNATTYAHYSKMCAHLKISTDWLIYGEKDQAPSWLNQNSPSEPTPVTTATHSKPSTETLRRRRTTLSDDEVAERLEILERRYAVVADRFLSLAERAEHEGVYVSPREIAEIKIDLEGLTGAQ